MTFHVLMCRQETTQSLSSSRSALGIVFGVDVLSDDALQSYGHLKFPQNV